MQPMDYLKTRHNLQPVKITPISTGFGIEGYKVQLEDGQKLALKACFSSPSDEFIREAEMLEDLKRAGWPVPAVRAADRNGLIISWLENDNSTLSVEDEFKTGKLLAKLHRQPAPYFGYDRKTPIARLSQPNTETEKWIEFFKTRRLLHFAQKAAEEGKLPVELFNRLILFASQLDKWISEPEQPCLIHGDLWGGNVIVNEGKLQGFIDPAIYYAHPEIELAFTQMFHTFGPEFFKGYQTISPLKPGFFEKRLPIYNLYPALVHVRLFGSSYLAPIARCLETFGY